MSIQKMKKFFKSAAVTLVTAAMCFGAVNPVMAYDPVINNNFDNIPIKNTITVADGVTIPTIDYTYTFTFVDKDGDKDANHPTLNVEATDRTDNNRALIQDTLNLQTAFNGFGAGKYTYTVTRNETFSAESDDTYTYTDGQETYTMVVYVHNKTDGSGTEIVSVGLVDADEEISTGTKLSEFTFTDTLTRTSTTGEAGALTISKTVEGEYGDKKFDFPFTITLTKAEGIEDETVTVTLSGDYTWTSENATVEEEKVTLSYNTPYTFTLKHEGSLVMTGLPYGTQYTVSENLESPQNDEYTTTVDNTNGNYESTTRTVEEAFLTDTPTNGANSVAYTNEFKDTTITPTGFLIDNMPFILLIVIGAAGIGAYIISRRRHYQG